MKKRDNTKFIFIVFAITLFSCKKNNIEYKSKVLNREINFAIIDSISNDTIKVMDVAICHDQTELPIHVLFKDYKVNYSKNGVISFNPFLKKVIGKKGNLNYFLYFKKNGYNYQKTKLSNDLNNKSIKVNKIIN